MTDTDDGYTTTSGDPRAPLGQPPSSARMTHGSGAEDLTRVVLRPLASPLPLGFLALAVATFAFACVQLSWIPQAQGHTVALGVLVLTVPLQFLAAVMGFLSRDPVAATGMGILSGAWAAASLATLTSPAGATSDGLGVILLCVGACLLVPAAAARHKVVPALVILTSATRFAVTGIAEIDGGKGWLHAAGWVGIALGIISAYAALALELEDSESKTVLPLGRTGASKRAVNGRLGDQVEQVAREPGVRQQL
jgi:succinate-acetate transporter protein